MFPASTVARKLLMAVTGQLMILFVVVHAAGNSTIYFLKLNAYAAGLHALPFLAWPVRLVIITVIALHIYYAVVLKIENRAARPVAYVKKTELASTFAGRNMVWSGSIIGTFLVLHLLHFTFQTIDPSTSARAHTDSVGHADVFLMVARAFQQTGVAALYLLALAGLWLHLSHGIQSSFQTLGLNSERTFAQIRRGGSIVAWLLLTAYAAIPLAIFSGLLLR